MRSAQVTMRSIGGVLLVLAAAHLSWPVRAGAVPVVIYPPDGARTRAELGELSAMVHAALLRAASRGSALRMSTSENPSARCGPAARAPASCLAAVAGEGLVLLAVARTGETASVDLRAVDGEGRIFGPLRITVDFVIQNIDGLVEAILRLEALADGPGKTPAVAQASGPPAAAPARPETQPPGANPAPPAAAPASAQAPAQARTPAASAPPAPWDGGSAPQAPPARGGPPPRTSPRWAERPPAAPVAPITWAFELGGDRGTKELYRIIYADGSKQVVEGNTGLFFSAGAAFLPLLDARLRTRVTLGVKYTGQSASNGSLDYYAFPLELLETVDLEPLRFGAGMYALLGPRLSGKGILADVSTRFDNSVGYEIRGEWMMGRFRTVGLGMRYVWNRLRANGGSVEAPAFGLVLSANGR